MESICRICGADADTLRFRALACRACAAFFRRAVVKNQKFTCGNGNDCDLSAASRCVCRSCRFDACLAAGMSRSRVLQLAGGGASSPPDRNSLSEAGTSTSTSSGSNSPDSTTHISRALTPIRNETTAQEALEMRMPILHQLITGYTRLTDKRMNYSPFGPPAKDRPYEISHEYKMHASGLDYLNFFDFLLRYYPSINKLNDTLKTQILNVSYPYLNLFSMLVSTVRLFPGRYDRMAYWDGNYLEISSIGKFMAQGTMMTEEEAMAIFLPSVQMAAELLIKPLEKLNITSVEEVALLGLIIATAVLNDLPGYADDIAVDIQKQLTRELFEYYSTLTTNIDDKTNRFAQVSSLMPVLERLVAAFRENGLIAETFRSAGGTVGPMRRAIGCH